MNDKQPQHDPLLKAFASLPCEIEPSRDLWPDVAARIVGDSRSSHWITLFGTHRMRLAASFVGAAFGVLVAFYFVKTQPPSASSEDLSLSVGPATPDSFPVTQDEHYRVARAQLATQFAARLKLLPSQEQAKIEQGLKDIQNGLRALNEALQQHPDNLSLRRLILSSYQRELEYMQTIDALAESLPQDSTI